MRVAPLLHSPTALVMAAMVLMPAPIEAPPSRGERMLEQARRLPQISRERAITRAVNATGLKLTPTKVEYGLATDTSIPFADLKVVKRLAWRVVFQGVEIFGRNQQGVQEKNPNISQISVLIDAETGALLKVASPKPLAGGLSQEPGTALESRMIEECGLLMRSTSSMPKILFTQALGIADGFEPGVAVQAEEVVAYFGLMTDILRPQKNVNDRPFWIILAGGVSLRFPSAGPPGAPPVSRANRAMVVVDAEASTPYYARLN